MEILESFSVYKVRGGIANLKLGANLKSVKNINSKNSQGLFHCNVLNDKCASVGWQVLQQS